MSEHATEQHCCLGVYCQNCGETVAVPDRVRRRQIVEPDDGSDPQYVSTLLNLRCRACGKEYFYDVSEITQVDQGPRSPRAHAAGARTHTAPERFHLAHR